MWGFGNAKPRWPLQPLPLPLWPARCFPPRPWVPRCSRHRPRCSSPRPWAPRCFPPRPPRSWVPCAERPALRARARERIHPERRLRVANAAVEKKRNGYMEVRAVWHFYAPFRPSSSWVKCFNWGRASRADGLLLADMPNGHTTYTPPPRLGGPCF